MLLPTWILPLKLGPVPLTEQHWNVPQHLFEPPARSRRWLRPIKR